MHRTAIERSPRFLIEIKLFGAVLLAVAAAAVLALAPRASAAVTWSSPVTVSKAGDFAGFLGSPVVATDAKGDTIVAWLDRSGSVFGACPCKVRAAYRPAGGAFGTPVDVSPTLSDQDPVYVAMDAAGDSIVAYTAANTAYAAIRPAGGAFRAPAVADAPRGADGALIDGLAMDAAGDAVLAVTNDQSYTGPGTAPGGTVFDAEVVHRPAGGTFDSAHPQILSDGEHNAYARAIAMSPNGRAAIEMRVDKIDYSQPEADEPNSIAVAVRNTAGGSFSSPKTIETVTHPFEGQPELDASPHEVAIDDAGEYVASYERYDPDGSDPDANADTSAKASIDGGSPVLLSAASDTSASPGSVVINPGGESLASWRKSSSDGRERVSTRPAGGTFGSPATLAAGLNSVLTNAANAEAANGNVLAAGVGSDSSGNLLEKASIRPPGGSFPAPTTISPANDDSFGVGPAAAIGKTGDAAATWFNGNGAVRVAIGTVPVAKHTLTVKKSGTGKGTVTSSPAGISCGATCSHAYVSGTKVTLAAHPATGSRFAGWSGSGCSGTATCTVTMGSNHAVTATFAPIPPPNTRITKATVNATKGTASFAFTGSGGVGALHFKCRLDTASFTACTSPKSYTRLKRGTHTFRVEAIDSRGKADPTPAAYSFKSTR